MEPLYGYLLSALNLLPKTVETLNEHLPILESALVGDGFRTSLAAEAFREFWVGCSEIVEPQKGWPAGLAKCLVYSGQHRETSTAGLEEDSMKTPERVFALLPSSSSTLHDDAANEQGDESHYRESAKEITIFHRLRYFNNFSATYTYASRQIIFYSIFVTPS